MLTVKNYRQKNKSEKSRLKTQLVFKYTSLCGEKSGYPSLIRERDVLEAIASV